MSDLRDHEDQDRTKFSVDDILAEYGSKKEDRQERKKVVDFSSAGERALSRSPTTRLPPLHGQQTIRFPAVRDFEPDRPAQEEGPRLEKPRPPAPQTPRRPSGQAAVRFPPVQMPEEPEGSEWTGAEEQTDPPPRAHRMEPRAQPLKQSGQPPAPPSEQEQRERKQQRRQELDPDGDGIVEIEPANPLRNLAARLSSMKRRADHYADHMYDQAEPDEEDARADRYLPGVDEEDAPPEKRSPRPAGKREQPRPRPVPPDIPPAELAHRYTKGGKAERGRMRGAVFCALLCALVSLLDPALLGLETVSVGVPVDVLRQAVLLGLLGLTGALCAEMVGGGLLKLFTLRPGPESLLSLAFLATVADSAALLITRSRPGLPCSAVTAFGLAFGLWGDCARKEGDKLSARSAAQNREPLVVTLDEGKWSGRPAYAKWTGTQAGFGSQIQDEDGVQRVYRIAAPLLLVACLVCSLLAGAAGGLSRFLWALSATFTAAAAWSATLAYALPYRRLARRLFGVGAALAGWPGVERCREGGILLQDTDLFPTGTVQVTGVRVFGDFPNEKVVAYAASMMRVLDCGLTRPFHDLLRAQGAFYRECAQVRCHEGGISGAIRNQEVLVGTAAFMHLCDVELPAGLGVRSAIFCAIDGELAGIFALRYTMTSTVRPALAALMQAGASPILATRDPNLIPAVLGEKFKLPVERMEFPPVGRRLELSDPDQDHHRTPVALLSREGLGPYCDVVAGGLRLRSATRRGILFALLGSALGVALTFYLTYLGAAASLTPVNFLLYMALWLVPTLVWSGWVDRY